RDRNVTGVQTCALPISQPPPAGPPGGIQVLQYGRHRGPGIGAVRSADLICGAEPRPKPEPSEAGLVWRGAARERAQVSPAGGTRSEERRGGREGRSERA